MGRRGKREETIAFGACHGRPTMYRPAARVSDMGPLAKRDDETGL